MNEVATNHFNTKMKIINYKNYSDIDIQFLDEHGYISRNCTYGNFIRGNITNPYDRTVCGVGYFGEGKYKSSYSKKVISKDYVSWNAMLTRCYVEIYRNKYNSYYGLATVCEEWHNFQNFAEWYNNNKYEVDGRLHLDKDILFPGNKIYSPDTCLLVPQRINMLFLNKPNKRGLPNGISLTKSKKYCAEYNDKRLGTYKTLEGAYLAYSQEKEETIKVIADEYKDTLPKNVYEALLNYKSEILVDQNYKLIS